MAVKGPSKKPSKTQLHVTVVSHQWTFFCLTQGGAAEPVKVVEMENGMFESSYYPVSRGKYLVSVSWGGHNIPRR